MVTLDERAAPSVTGVDEPLQIQDVLQQELVSTPGVGWIGGVKQGDLQTLGAPVQISLLSNAQQEVSANRMEIRGETRDFQLA